MRLSSNYFRGLSLNLTTGSPGGVIRNNLVYGTGGTTVGAADQEVYGIEANGASFTIENNSVSDVAGKGNSGGYGIYTKLSGDAFVVNNRVSRANIGIRMNGPNEFRDNITSNCDTNYIAGLNIGNNN